MTYAYHWNLSEQIIKKHGLVNEGLTIGVSKRKAARIFALPEIADVYITECDHNGEPCRNHTAHVFCNRKRKFWMSVSVISLYHISHERLLRIINEEIKNCSN